MFARVTSAHILPEDTEHLAAGIQSFRDEFITGAQHLEGFVEAFLLVDRAKGTGMSVTLWDTEKHARASSSLTMRFLKAEVLNNLGIDQTDEIGIYEVAAHG